MDEAIINLLRYCPEVGGPCLVWKVSKRSHIKENMMAGSKAKEGYWQVQINKKNYPAHRVVYFLCTGLWPIAQIDHIDGNPSNNRIENLREATVQENGQNRKLNINNCSGYQGVTFSKSTNKWQSQIKANGSYKYLGVFITAEEAHEAYKMAKREFHQFNPEVKQEG